LNGRSVIGLSVSLLPYMWQHGDTQQQLASRFKCTWSIVQQKKTFYLGLFVELVNNFAVGQT